MFGLGTGATSWRGAGVLAMVFFGSLAFAAVLTPFLYWVVQWWNAQAPTETTKWLLGKGIDVYFDRLRWVPILAGLPWMMTVCHLWSRQAMGLKFDRMGWVGLANGFAGGLALVSLLATAQMEYGVVLRQPGVAWQSVLVNAVLAGVILGFFEETIFRGLILRIFYTATKRPWLALAVTSAFFAYTHFKVPPSIWRNVPPGVHWDTGWVVAFWTTCGIVKDFDWTQFLALWALGMVLGALTLRTGSLLPAIGLHAGLVTAMNVYRAGCVFPPDAPGRAIWGGGGLTDGWAAVVVLLVLFGLMVVTRGREN
ncbi:MAG: CPBP family intramembrane glutamic endopeptidase [Opitutales bacterium]